MKTIQVDAWNTFVTENWVNTEMRKLLDNFSNKKIILSNANEEEKVKFGNVQEQIKSSYKNLWEDKESMDLAEM